MANQEHLDILKQGVEIWNQWRKGHPETRLDLSGIHNNANLSDANFISVNLSDANLIDVNLSNASLFKADLKRASLDDARLFKADLPGADLGLATLTYARLDDAKLSDANLLRANFNGANLSGSDLRSSNLSGTDLSFVNLSNADLSDATLENADLNCANLCRANLSRTNLSEANLSRADLHEANLSEANLSEAMFVQTNLSRATLTGCAIYGISVWDVQLEGAEQNNLIITPSEEPTITVDNLKVAQFIYLLLNNAEIRDVIDTIARKAVLILGRFTPPRKAVLDALREALRTQGYVPILFDFDKPASRDLTGTISTLAHLARFIVVDLTDPSSAPHEVATVIPQTVVPVQPVMLDGEREYSMFQDLRQRYHWVLPTHYYTDQAHLLATLKEKVIEPAEQKAQELEKR